MLDKRTELILSAINTKCEEGSYKVMEAADILSQLPKQYAMDGEGLSDIINYLCDREYLKCKYSDSKVYCLSPLPKGRLYQENAATEKKQRFSYKKLLIWAFIGSVLGGALGAGAYQFIITLIGG